MTGDPARTRIVREYPGWTSAEPFLSGSFAPVFREVEADDLPVVAGKIPEDVSGTYLRNGSNPLFKPMSYTWPFDGDGMIHAVQLDNGRARYRNRFVQTRGLTVEHRAGRAVYGGVMRPVPVDPSLVGPDGEPGPVKNGAFVNVIRHAGRVLALGEASPAYEMTADLETLGEWRPGTDEPIQIGAHNRRHPRTGDLFGLTYFIDQPRVRFQRIDAGGRLSDSFEIGLAVPTMIHDFVLTERHIVLLTGPLVIDIPAAMRGLSPLQWRPELGTRICVLGQDGSSPLWLEAEPYFVFHFANGFEEKGRIVLDYVRHSGLGAMVGQPADGVPPRLHRMAIDLTARRIEDAAVADLGVEFPRADDRLEARVTRYVVAPTRAGSGAGSFNAIARLDTHSGAVALHEFGSRLAGEAVVVPRPGGADEADGWLAVFVYDPATDGSDFVLLDARDPAAEPVAVVRLPQRVPQGLHGNWLPKA
ncbi:MAG: carotenoid oxygenase family protein [Geminicoccaceae bacterium]